MLEQWQSMHASKKGQLEQFNETKFGIFIHWGVYSVPAGIWKGEKIGGLGEWVFYHAQIPREEYKSLPSQFNPVNFDAKEWVQIAKDAGMKYIVAMPKHHDGFAMYDSKVTDYDIIDATPFDRDPIQELYEECKKAGLRFGIYYSHATDWMDGGDAGVADYLAVNPPEDTTRWTFWPANKWDPSPMSFEKYIRKKAKPQMKELMTKLPELQEIWYDVPQHMTLKQSFEFYKLAFDLQPECLINSRVGNNLGDFWIPGDNKIPTDEQLEKEITWETPGTLNNTWGFKSYDVDWKSTDELIFWIIEIASKGGNYLLNVGPKADGTIPIESVESLQSIGKWMKVNGEAIYGTTKWTINKEGPTVLDMQGTRYREEHGFVNPFTHEDIWFTTKENSIYALSLQWPEDGEVLIKSITSERAKNVQNVRLLGSDKPLKWNQDTEGLHLSLPESATRELGFVLKIETES